MIIKTKDLTFIALFVSITIILSQIVIPVEPVPISLSMIGVFLSGGILGWKKGMISQIVYLLLGIVGIPVFANLKGGIGVLLGPTGGYLIGYVITAGVIGYYMEKYNIKSLFAIFSGMLIGLSCCYLVGTYWLGYYLQVSFIKALSFGVIPFLLGDILKIILCGILVLRLKKFWQY